MRVSFIIPLFNCLPLTQAMLASLQATLPPGLDHEIILIDDGSTDGTRDWLQTLDTPHLRVLLNDRNLGYAASNNRAASLATGDLLLLLNNDLVLSPRWLEPMLAAHASLGAKAGILGNIQRSVATGEIDHAGIAITKQGKPTQSQSLSHIPSRLKKVPAVTGACLLISRSLWLRLGGFDERYINGCEDIDLCFKALAAGLTNAVALRSIIYHHVSSSPGRRRHDEENTRRLTIRWRLLLSDLGSRDWARSHVVRESLAGTHIELPFSFLGLCLHALGLLRRPPPAALRGISEAIDHEHARWQSILG